MLRIICVLSLLFSHMCADKWVAIGAGCCGIVRPKDRNWMIQIEYQPNPLWKPVSWFDLKPQAGFFINSRTAAYVYGGFRFEFKPNAHILITPGFASGVYIRGQGKKLHFPLEFKSSLELAFQYRYCENRTQVIWISI